MRTFACLAVAVAAGLSGCGADSAASGSGSSLDVVATTTQLGDIVRAVGGSAVDVHQILQPNSDPHDYDPRPDDVKSTAGAKLVLESGNNLDKWMAEVVDEAGGSPNVVTIAPDFTPDKVAGESSGPEASKFDPHWWHDPRNVESAVTAISAALSKADPARAGVFKANAAAYGAKVKALDAGIEACIDTVPAAQRKLVTSHDAFNYFARRYGIDVVGAVIPSQSTQAQPSAGQISALAALVKREGVKAIYPESSINPKLAEALAAQTGARSDYTLYGDTLGPAGSSGDTYLKMEQANAGAMVKGFTGGARGCSISGI
jgi:zinc/manganese transport system substrate-binding protein